MIELFFDFKSILLEFLYLLADYELSRIHNDCTINNRNYQVVYCIYRLKISNLKRYFSHNINLIVYAPSTYYLDDFLFSIISKNKKRNYSYSFKN